MLEHVITVCFDVESEAYQALSELKNNAVTSGYVVSNAALVKNDAGHILTVDCFDTGVETEDDTAMGGTVGALCGIIGGPIGMLLGGSVGAMVGGAFDAADAGQSATVLEEVCKSIPDGKTCLLAMVQEAEEGSFDRAMGKFGVTITRQNAAEVAEEVERAEQLQRQMERDARRELRAEKNAERKARVEAKRAELEERFSKFMEKI